MLISIEISIPICSKVGCTKPTQDFFLKRDLELLILKGEKCDNGKWPFRYEASATEIRKMVWNVVVGREAGSEAAEQPESLT